MTRTRYRIYESEYPYFLTCTINGWLPVFTKPEAADIIFASWKFLQEKQGLSLFSYVILENHLHFIASAPDLNQLVRNFKSFTARKLIELLQSSCATTLLRQLRINKRNHKLQSEYQIWHEGSKPKQIFNDDMMWLKIEYIHNNPLARGFVDDPLHWRWSSARNYAGQPGLIDVITDWR